MVDSLPAPQRLVCFCGADSSQCNTYRSFLAGDEGGLVNTDSGYRCCWLPGDFPQGKDCEIKTCCEERRLDYYGECGDFSERERMIDFYTQPGYELLHNRMPAQIESRNADECDLSKDDFLGCGEL